MVGPQNAPMQFWLELPNWESKSGEVYHKQSSSQKNVYIYIESYILKWIHDNNLISNGKGDWWNERTTPTYITTNRTDQPQIKKITRGSTKLSMPAQETAMSTSYLREYIFVKGH